MRYPTRVLGLPDSLFKEHQTMKPTIALLAALLLASPIALHAMEFFVSPAGNDSDSGSRAKPFATLERARDAIRETKRAGATAGGVTVWLGAGDYPVTTTFELTAVDSSTAENPVVYRSVEPGKARLLGARPVKSADFKPVTNANILARIDPAARGKVVQLNLASLSLANAKTFANVFTNGGGLFELFVNDRRMPLSRWPNEDATTMGKVLDKGDASSGPQRHGGKFVAREERCTRWHVESGVWLEGYWRVPWRAVALRVKSIDAASRTIEFAEPDKELIGSKYAPAGQLGDGKETWCALNLLEEIDRPGEWCVDFTSGTLYFWPPDDLSRAAIYVTDQNTPLVTLKDVSHVTFRDLSFEGNLGNGLEISGGSDALVAGCTFRNLGGSGVLVRGGQRHGVRSSDFYDLGQGGIYLGGGDRKTLTPANHFAENNHLHHLGLRQKTYAAGIHVGAYGATDAVGCRVAHNFIHDLPHAGVLYGGNDNVFEFNEISRVVLTSGDMGAFYTANDWTSRGNIVRHNYVHDSPRANAFYMDDGDSGDTISGNVVRGCFYGPFIGGGHDNLIENNLIIDTERAIHIDSRGVARGYQNNPGMIKRLRSFEVQLPPWSTRYPTLAKLLDGQRDIPLGNVIRNNVTVRCKTLIHTSGKPTELQAVAVQDNLDLGAEDAGFVDEAHGNFQLRPDSPIFKKMPAFQPIPFEKIGLVKDEFRTQLPATAGGQTATTSRKGNFDSETDLRHDQRK